MKPLNYILRKCKKDYAFTKLQVKINYHIHMDINLHGINFFPRMKRIKNPNRVSNQDIGMKFGIEKYANFTMEKVKGLQQKE